MTRVSCRVILRITDEHGRYLLVLDKERRKLYGETAAGALLAPPGDYVQATVQGTIRLQHLYLAYGFENNHDLRFYVDQTRVHNVRDWFMDRHPRERETTINRVLSQLFWDDAFYGNLFVGKSAHTINRSLIGTSTEVGQTFRPYVQESETVWLIETFRVTLRNGAMVRAVDDAAERWTSPFFFVSDDEIERGVTHTGWAIDQRLARRLLVQDTTTGA